MHRESELEMLCEKTVHVTELQRSFEVLKRQHKVVRGQEARPPASALLPVCCHYLRRER